MTKAKPKAKAKRKTKPATRWERVPVTAPDVRLYTLEVSLAEMPYGRSKKFKYKKWRPPVSRTIQIRGDQTLSELHDAIFEAFDRYDEHLWKFCFGTGPFDPSGIWYQFSPLGLDGFEDRPDMPNVRDEAGITLDALNLQEKQVFGYNFDFGDDWWHEVKVTAIETGVPAGKFPRVTQRVGDSPPQYPDVDDDE